VKATDGFFSTFTIWDRLSDDSPFCVDINQQSRLLAVADCGVYQADPGANFCEQSRSHPKQRTKPWRQSRIGFHSCVDLVLE